MVIWHRTSLGVGVLPEPKKANWIHHEGLTLTHCTMSRCFIRARSQFFFIGHCIYLCIWIYIDLICNCSEPLWGAGGSSEVERLLMVQWVVGSILHGVDPLSYFSFQPVLHDWCNKGCGMCYPVCGMVHIKEPLLLIDKSSLCGGSGFPFSLSEWSLTICLTPYNCR